jgi:ankyrin repeat protein
MASRNNCIEVVKELLDHEPTPDLKVEDDDNTALTVALKCQHDKGAIFLLDGGANIGRPIDSGKHQLHHIVEYNQENVLRAMLQLHPELDRKDNNGDTAMNRIKASTDVSLLRCLLNAGADPEIANTRGRTPIWTAVSSGNTKLVKYLGSKKVRVNYTSGSSTSLWNIAPLHDATSAFGGEVMGRRCRQRASEGTCPLAKS